MTSLLQIGLLWLLQSTLLLTLGLLSLHVARKSGPAAQTAIGRAALLAVALNLLLACPLTGHIQPLWRVSLPSTVTHAGPPIAAKPMPLPEITLAPTAAISKPMAAAPILPFTPPPNPTPPVSGGETRSVGVGLLWPLGTALLLLWLAACQWHLTALRRAARRLTSGPVFDLLSGLTPCPPELFTHPAVRSPFLAGILHPVIFLPTNAEIDFTPAALRAILAHELAHRDRRDNLWLLLSRLLTALLWPQPLLWLLCRRLEAISEEACDLAVLAQNCPPRAYADCLLTLAERRPPSRRERALGAGVAPYRSSLGRRVQQILSKGTQPMPTVSTHLRLTIAIVSLTAVLGGMFLVSSAPAQVARSQTVKRTPEQERGIALRKRDMNNLKQIGLAFLQYEQEHTYHLPKAANWMDAISPYLKDKTVLFDPFHPDRYGYAYNRNCSGKSLAAFASPAETVMAFDSSLGVRNANDVGQSLKSVGYSRDNSFPGSALLYLDSHVKWTGTNYRPRPPFLTPSPPPIFATEMPLKSLIRERDKARAALPKLQKLFDRDTQKFDRELHALLPNANAQTFAQVRTLEIIIGSDESSLQSSHEMLKTPWKYRAISSDPNRLTLAVISHSDALIIGHSKDLRKQEAALLPGVPNFRLAHLHVLAGSVGDRRGVVPYVQGLVKQYNEEIEYRQSLNSAQ